MFIYVDIIHYLFMGDTKALLLRAIDTKRRVELYHFKERRKSFFDFDLSKVILLRL